MAIYGINFNGIEIPPAIRRRFAGRLKRSKKTQQLYPVGAASACDLRLVGVATTEQDKNSMFVQANNGHRTITIIERKTAGAPFYGIYEG